MFDLKTFENIGKILYNTESASPFRMLLMFSSGVKNDFIFPQTATKLPSVVLSKTFGTLE